MVQIFQAPESSADQFATQIGQNFGQGLSGGISNALSEMLKQKQQTQKARHAVPNTFNSIAKQFGADKAYDEATRRKSVDRARQLVDEGYDDVTASLMAYDEMIKPKETTALQDLNKKGALANLGEDFLGATAKLSRPAVGVLGYPIEAANAAEKGIEKGASKVRELLGLDKEKPFGQGPLGNLRKPINPFANESLINKYDRLTGGRGIPQTGAQNVVSQSIFGIPGIIGGLAEETLKGLGVPEEYAPLGNIAGLIGGARAEPKIIESLTNLVQKIPSAWNAITKAVKPSVKAATGATATETAAKTQQATQAKAQEVVQETASKLAGRGVDLTKVAEGDPAAVNEFQKEATKTAKLFEESEKFHKKEAIKRRTETAEKLKESPLEQYYEPKEKGPKTAKGQAAEELRVAPLNERIQSLDPQVKSAYRRVLEAEESLRGARVKSPEYKARLESSRDLARLEHSRLLSELKNTEFEIRNRKPPASSEEIGKQIEKQHAEIREGIKDPTVEKIGKIKKGLEKDKSAVEQAQKLVARGELPGPKVFDEYIKIHEQYNKAYGDLIKELGDYVKANKNLPEMKSQVANANHIKKLVQDLKTAGEAKVTNQIDKRKAMRAIDKPSGAFYRQMLKDLKKDIEGFQKNFFDWRKIETPGQAAEAATIRGKIATDIPATASKAAKNPTAENISKLSERTGVPAEDLGQFMKDTKKAIEEGATKVKEGTATPKDAAKTTKSVIDAYKKLGRLSRALLHGTVVGTITGLSEEFFGYKPPQALVALGGSVVGGKSTRGVVGAGSIATIVHNLISGAFEKGDVSRLKSYRNSPKFNEERKRLSEKHGESYANKIMKKAIAS